MGGSEAVALVVLLLLAMRQKSIEWGDGWVWPVPDLNRVTRGVLVGIVPAVVSQEFRGAGAAKPHYGVDLMYRKAARKPGESAFFAPSGVPVVAARAGELWSVSRTPRGWAIVLDHGKPFATFYQHLESVDSWIAAGVQGVSRSGQPLRVEAGQRLGVMGYDPMDARKVVHLHFAVWYQGSGDKASVDPAPQMASWGRSSIVVDAGTV